MALPVEVGKVDEIKDTDARNGTTHIAMKQITISGTFMPTRAITAEAAKLVIWLINTTEKLTAAAPRTTDAAECWAGLENAAVAARACAARTPPSGARPDRRTFRQAR